MWQAREGYIKNTNAPDGIFSEEKLNRLFRIYTDASTACQQVRCSPVPPRRLSGRAFRECAVVPAYLAIPKKSIANTYINIRIAYNDQSAREMENINNTIANNVRQENELLKKNGMQGNEQIAAMKLLYREVKMQF